MPSRREALALDQAAQLRPVPDDASINEVGEPHPSAERRDGLRRPTSTMHMLIIMNFMSGRRHNYEVAQIGHTRQFNAFVAQA
jgi:hypothetical protein